jgi:hypothetical protein
MTRTVSFLANLAYVFVVAGLLLGFVVGFVWLIEATS